MSTEDDHDSPSDDAEHTTERKNHYPVPPANAGAHTGENYRDHQNEWAANYHDILYTYLTEHYGVSESDIIDIEGQHDGNPNADDGQRALQHLDYTGLDKLVKLPDRTLTLGFRVRRQSFRWDVDFSYCYDNGSRNNAEWGAHLAAFRKGGFYPDHYAFAIANDIEDDEGPDDDRKVVYEFHLIDVTRFLDAIDSGDLIHSDDRDREGGVSIYFYPVDTLREHGCIIESWDDPRTEDDV